MAYFYEDSIQDPDNCIRPTTTGWAVYWQGTKEADGLTRDAAIALFRQLQKGTK